ncbi:MAG: hypothetical protein FH749_01550 [Firmicutes bacterium]|nr:hypothetical protein [Bacillota bacterium]
MFSQLSRETSGNKTRQIYSVLFFLDLAGVAELSSLLQVRDEFSLSLWVYCKQGFFRKTIWSGFGREQENRPHAPPMLREV